MPRAHCNQMRHHALLGMGGICHAGPEGDGMGEGGT